jgi:long-subunit fatty acid transport protein
MIFYGIAMAGGIVTNTNQSAMYTRLQVRDATLGIDATYFNPAGLTLLPNNGFFLSLNNQTLGQTRTISTDYEPLNNSEYKGEISAPFFPGVYAAYKLNKFAFSFGFNPIGGGGGGTYSKGLPSFEYQISDLAPTISGQLAPLDQMIEGATGTNPGFSNVTGYQANINFEGSSIYFGYQANVSYQITDIFSVAIGGRYVTAKDTYKGSITDIQIHAPEIYGGTQTAGQYVTLVSQTPGLPPEVVTQLQGTAIYLSQATMDTEVDVEQTASGFTPIISVNIKASEKFNFALKYEHQTKLEFETKVIDGKDGQGMYTDGEKHRHDIPSQIVIGGTYNPIENLLITTGFHSYLDKNANWEGKEKELDHNSWEFGLGLEYGFTEKFKASAGWLKTKSGATEAYQSDLSFSLPSNSVGGGIAWQIIPIMEVNLGGSYTIYAEGEKNFSYEAATGERVPIKETYLKPIWIVAIGLNFNFGATK